MAAAFALRERSPPHCAGLTVANGAPNSLAFSHDNSNGGTVACAIIGARPLMATDQHGPFDRILRPRTAGGTPSGGDPVPDRAAIYVGGTIIGLAILLLVLVLPPISILSGGDDNASDIQNGPGVADTYGSNPRNGMPKLPAGLVAVSALFELSAPEGQAGASAVTVDLKEQQTEPRNLGLYTYIDGKWQRLSDVALSAGGNAARGDVTTLPGNVVVLRRSKATLQVAGSMPAGLTLDPQADSALTTLHPIVFIPIETGALIGQPPAVPPAGYEVVPGIVAPNPAVVDDLLRSGELRSAHVLAIADAVKQGNYAGINVDYRGVNETLKEQFASFADALATTLHEDGRTLTLTLPMPSSQEGAIDEGAYDWEALGAAADSIEMVGELDQELYFQNTEAALTYVTDKVDRSKILLTISALSVERGSDGLRTMPLADALALASVVGVTTETDVTTSSQVPLLARNLAQGEGASGLRWDDTSRAVTFSYPGRGGRRTVWIANRYSAAFRLELAQRYGLGGVAITDVSEDGASDIWAPVQELADTGDLSLTKPNGDLFTPTWLSSDGSIAPSSGDAVTWTAPAEAGTYGITLVVSDGVVRVGQQITIDVVEGAAAPTDAPPPAE